MVAVPRELRPTFTKPTGSTHIQCPPATQSPNIFIERAPKFEEHEINAATAITAQYPAGDPGMTYALWGEMSNQDRKDYLEAAQ